MGLEDLMKESGVDDEPNKEEKKSTSKEKENSSSSGGKKGGRDSAMGIQIDYEPVDSHISYDDDVKPCPSCITVSEKTGRREWTCPNDDCGVINFTAGWNERFDGKKFLQNIDWAKVEEELQDILRFD